MTFEVGQRAFFAVTYADQATGEPAEPTGIKARVESPAGVVTEPEVTITDNMAEVEVVLNESGTWQVTVEWPEQDSVSKEIAVIAQKVPA